MSVQYSAVKWNRNKRVYDGVLLAGILLYLGLFFLDNDFLTGVCLPVDGGRTVFASDSL